MAEELLVMGATLRGFAQACINLNIVAGEATAETLADIGFSDFYPFERLRALEEIVVRSYADAAPILERVGVEMMIGWYRHGPGSSIVATGVDFLRFQSGSQGYASVVRGPPRLVGQFDLVDIDEQRGRARIHSTTPFEKNLERGVIIGGMSAPGDLAFVDVDNRVDSSQFNIEFH